MGHVIAARVRPSGESALVWLLSSESDCVPDASWRLTGSTGRTRMLLAIPSTSTRSSVGAAPLGVTAGFAVREHDICASASPTRTVAQAEDAQRFIPMLKTLTTGRSPWFRRRPGEG